MRRALLWGAVTLTALVGGSVSAGADGATNMQGPIEGALSGGNFLAALSLGGLYDGGAATGTWQCRAAFGTSLPSQAPMLCSAATAGLPKTGIMPETLVGPVTLFPQGSGWAMTGSLNGWPFGCRGGNAGNAYGGSCQYGEATDF